MAEHGIRARTKRKFKATTDSRHNLPVTANLMAPQTDAVGLASPKAAYLWH